MAGIGQVKRIVGPAQSEGVEKQKHKREGSWKGVQVQNAPGRLLQPEAWAELRAQEVCFSRLGCRASPVQYLSA